MVAASSSPSSTSPAERRNGELDVGLEARGVGEAVRLLANELVVEPELELPLR